MEFVSNVTRNLLLSDNIAIAGTHIGSPASAAKMLHTLRKFGSVAKGWYCNTKVNNGAVELT